MQRRQLLKLAPLAALAATSMNVNGVEFKEYELQKDKKYLFVFGSEHVTAEQIETFSKAAKGCGIDGMMVAGDADLKIYELEAKREAK